MRRSFLALALMLLAAPAWAETFEEQVAAALAEKGYDVLTMERTWFGRLRVLAEDGESRRELVFNPGTGEILRDYSVPLASLEEEEPPRGLHHWDRNDDDDGNDGLAATGSGSIAATADAPSGAEVVINEPLSLGGN